MKRFWLLLLLLQTTSSIRAAETTKGSPEILVRNLYREIVARRPLGIPYGKDKSAIWPFLSKRLVRQLETAKACEGDYDRQHSSTTDKPEFGWLEGGLFSGDNEEASPNAASVERTERQGNGSFLVYVQLRYRDWQKPNPEDFHWRVAVKVIREGGRFVVDDVLFFEEESTKVLLRLSEWFRGCDGPRWVGEKTSASHR